MTKGIQQQEARRKLQELPPEEDDRQHKQQQPDVLDGSQGTQQEPEKLLQTRKEPPAASHKLRWQNRRNNDVASRRWPTSRRLTSHNHETIPSAYSQQNKSSDEKKCMPRGKRRGEKEVILIMVFSIMVLKQRYSSLPAPGDITRISPGMGREILLKVSCRLALTGYNW